MDKLELPAHLRGYALIREPLYNKGSAFTREERLTLGLEGLLPTHINTMEQQVRRAYGGLSGFQNPLEKYVGLAALQDRNEHLFYRLLTEYIEEFMPIVYTPTVGLATQNFSQVFQRGRGLWITPEHRGQMDSVLANAAGDRDIRLIVVTDNESILGIGDQGAGGMAISVGKLALYVAGAGFNPGSTLPVSLDVGTENQALLDDDLYLGWRQPRLRGAEYDAFVDEFVESVRKLHPNALVQWEDFRKDNALEILNRHRHSITSFNDDIQGTGAVALAGVLGGLRVTGESLADQRVLIHGAGAAGLGIARQIGAAMKDLGVNDLNARERIGVLDSRGLLVDDKEIADSYKQELAWDSATAEALGLSATEDRQLQAVVERFQPTVLIGSSGQAGAFTKAVVTAMAQATDRPIILPFSNPTASAEATPANVIEWSDGRALVATGSPFADVTHSGRTIRIGQGNNVFVFPGLGLGALASGAREVTDSQVSAAAQALADQLTDEELASGLLFPEINRLADVSKQVAIAVAQQAHADGIAEKGLDEAIDEIENGRWQPKYPQYQAG